MKKRKGNRGYKKYRCDECGTEENHHWIERNRAARLRCTRCGSARMQMVNKDAVRETARAQAVRVQGGTPSTSTIREPQSKKVT